MEGEAMSNYLQLARRLAREANPTESTASTAYEIDERNEISRSVSSYPSGFCAGCGGVPDTLSLTAPFEAYCAACITGPSRLLNDEERCGQDGCRNVLAHYDDGGGAYCVPCWYMRPDEPPVPHEAPALPEWTNERRCHVDPAHRWRWETGGKTIVCGGCRPEMPGD